MLILEDGHVAMMRSQMREYVRLEVLSAMQLEADGQLKLADSEAVDFRVGDYLVELESGPIYIVKKAEWEDLGLQQYAMSDGLPPEFTIADPTGLVDPESLENLDHSTPSGLSEQELALLSGEERRLPLEEQQRMVQFYINEGAEVQMKAQDGERFVAPDKMGA